MELWMTDLDLPLTAVTKRIAERSAATRAAYLAQVTEQIGKGPRRTTLSCGNVAHVAAACGAADKHALLGPRGANIGIVTSYNDMVSAHQPFEAYPALIKSAVREVGAVAQVAGGVPAMCDGITQGQDGMELSLFSRDVIAMSTAIALSHDAFDAALYLGVCDKIVPGLVIGALTFGHLPAVFVPAGPMPTGLPNKEKVRVRQLFAEGKVGRAELLEAEAKSYHSAGTCTFYGTANSNQMLMEIMGLHLPGSSFVNPNTPLREALTKAAAQRAVAIADAGDTHTPIAKILDVPAFVNGMVGLLATGGSTNHTMHLVAMARAAGIILTWDDFSTLSEVVPLLVRAYPNGPADINHFHAAGGMGFLIRTLRDGGLLHDDVTTILGHGLADYTQEPYLEDGQLNWRDAATESHDLDVLRPCSAPFQATGGLKLLAGSLGRAVIKVSAVATEHQRIEAPAKVFHSQADLMQAFAAGELTSDFIAVLPYQGPRACGMPELHKLTSAMGVLQDRGLKVALVTDGRMSGASGKVPAAIHVTPEAADGGAIAKVLDGDMLLLDATTGTLEILVDPAEFAQRHPGPAPIRQQRGVGRELFGRLRELASSAETGASILG
jgi:phosphogluconate dehydratase